jgi:hypothetical protein
MAILKTISNVLDHSIKLVSLAKELFSLFEPNFVANFLSSWRKSGQLKDQHFWEGFEQVLFVYSGLESALVAIESTDGSLGHEEGVEGLLE